jgi:hypothetical protein
MSIFTMSLQEALDYNSDKFPTYKYFGLDTFPVAEEFENKDLFRASLAQKIIDHYWNREIGLESFSMWRFNMRRKMNEIMPYYNKLYVTELIKFDPLSTMDMESESSNEQESTGNGTSTSAGDSTSTSQAVASDYPQTRIENNGTGNFATTGQDSRGTSTTTGNGQETRTDNATATGKSSTKGYAGSASALLTEYRSVLLNIDMMVISAVEELFMQVLGNGDSYTGNGYWS